MAKRASIVLVGLLAAALLASRPHAAPHTWADVLRPMKVDLLNQTGSVTERARPLSDLLSSAGPTVVGFWATYCPPCIEEMALFNELHREGHRVIGLSLDTGEEEAVRHTWTERKVRYPGAILSAQALSTVGRLLEKGLPTTLVLDRSGKVVAEIQGLTTRRALLEALKVAHGTSRNTPAIRGQSM